LNAVHQTGNRLATEIACMQFENTGVSGDRTHSLAKKHSCLTIAEGQNGLDFHWRTIVSTSETAM